ncbi:TonB-dependent receptor [Mucilaginibacter sp. NFR10]|uniref:TonB-dependent receptor n=2 Tax=unclassified Mucilaginibacter TaxID=2617802 RepID=UPI0008717CFB|nr:TonB-dependent receptor [Mucilaginibacter sp. NFR10]SCW48547.1 Carboxypeptidase regulatory-like domain-containing protein [Mucilaginibacter sp. NFR10]
MKHIFFILFLMVATNLKAQQIINKDAPKLPAREFRQVSGIVQDSTGTPVARATVILKSAKDSMATSSDKDGIFIFENVREATFLLTVSEVGFTTKVSRYLNNEETKKIVLAPIILKDQYYQLKQVNVNGTPTIVYKTDTVQYRASDYKVPAYSTVDQLLKKMEGMEVGADGTLVHQGQQVTKAKLNGKVFGGGNVAQAIQNLPASIVDKIQIVDDYGDQAARTGIKDGAPSKTLNITTRADKSIGTIARIVSQEGNHGRYNEQLSVQHINANRVINLIGNVSSTVNGVASTSPTSSVISAPGTTRSGSPTFSYTDDWGSKIVATGSYVYNFNNTNSISNTYGFANSSNGLSNFINNSTVKNSSRGNTVKFQLEDNLDKSNYLQINATFNNINSSATTSTLTSNLNYFTTGFEHPVVNLEAVNSTTGHGYGLTALFVHTFKKPKRNFSIQAGFTQSNSQIKGDKSTEYRYYLDTTQNTLVKDSLSHLIINKTSNSKVYRSVVTYVEPLTARAQLEFTGQIRNAVYDNKAISDTVLANGQLQELTRLENTYHFSFTETRTTVDYRYSGRKSNLSLGATFVSTALSGTQVDNNTANNVSTSRLDFRIIPVFRYSYSWSTSERFQIAYSGINTEPEFQQIQPFIDRSDPNNIIIGNPNLKPTFTHSVTASYNKYFPNDKFNISFNVDGRLYDNQVATNIVQITAPISATLNKTINEINYVNINGDKAITGGYSISKQLNDRNYYLGLNGSITYGYFNAVSNSISYHTSQWDFNERFGPQISLNDNKFIISPYIGYEVNRSFTNTLNATSNTIQTTKLAIDGQIYLPRNFQLHYNAIKNYISGFTNYKQNPLVINAGFEKRFSMRTQSLALTFDVFDLLHQNNFLQQSVTPQSTTYTQSNTLSRYFLVGLKLNLQKWGGTPMHNGQPLKRRGDGSFIH